MDYSVSPVMWEHAAPLLKDVRERVFICERRIPKKIEFDNKDKQAVHILVCDDVSQEPIATGRILPCGEISRIAVIKQYRHNRLDKLVVKRLSNIAKELSLSEVYIHCPLDTVDYFKRNNFYRVGNVFMEAGLPKQRMACPIDALNGQKCYLSH